MIEERHACFTPASSATAGPHPVAVSGQVGLDHFSDHLLK
jgi:hypothetical protein